MRKKKKSEKSAAKIERGEQMKDTVTISIYYNRLEPYLKRLNFEQKGKLFSAICDYFIARKEPNFDDIVLDIAFEALKVDFDYLIDKRETQRINNSKAGIKSGEVRRKKRDEQQADTIQTDGSGTPKAIQSTTKPVLSQRVEHTSAEPSTLDLKEISGKRKAEGAERIEEITEKYRKQREKGQTDDNTGAEMLAINEMLARYGN